MQKKTLIQVLTFDNFSVFDINKVLASLWFEIQTDFIMDHFSIWVCF